MILLKIYTCRANEKRSHMIMILLKIYTCRVNERRTHMIYDIVEAIHMQC